MRRTQSNVVALFPAPTNEPGEYLTLLRDALEETGIPSAPPAALTPRWASRHAGDVRVVHLHWLEFIAPSDSSPYLGTVRTARRALRVFRSLRKLRRREVAIVWTVHNLSPHEPVHPRIERWLARAVLAISDAAIVHSEHARTQVASRLGHARKLHAVPHGNYLDAYPPAAHSALDRRRTLGLAPDAFVYLSFGQVRAYKCLPQLLEAFRSLPDEDIALLIAGEPRDPREEARVRSQAAEDPRVVLDLRRIPAGEVAAVHSVADAAVFPYDGMFSSGSVLLALSHGLPVIVPSDSTGTELAAQPASEAIGVGGIAAALRAVRRGDQQIRRDAALSAAARYDWGTVGSETARVYRLATGDRARRGQARAASGS